MFDACQNHFESPAGEEPVSPLAAPPAGRPQRQGLAVLGELALHVAHDLNNILVPVLSVTEMVRAGLAADDENDRLLAVVEQAGRHARDLVRQILSFNGRQESERRPLDLAQLLKAAMPLVRASVPKTVTVRERLDRTALVLGDPCRLQQLVFNLLANAVQAIGAARGTIAIELESVAGGIRLSISDTGAGMDAATQARIFEPFFTTRAPQNGIGIGLSIVKAIAAAHDGRIEVHSEDRKGSRFELHLPALATPASGERA